jgi:hypothetical protein
MDVNSCARPVTTVKQSSRQEFKQYVGYIASKDYYICNYHYILPYIVILCGAHVQAWLMLIAIVLHVNLL